MDDIYRITDEAIKLAGKWQDRANALQTPRERARQHKFARLGLYLKALENPAIEYI